MTAPLLNRRCSVPGCLAKHLRRGYCHKHACQVDRHGRLTPERERKRERGPCPVHGCEREDAGRGPYCRRHARQVRTHGRLTPEREHEKRGPGCTVPGCPKPHRAKGLCIGHYYRSRIFDGARPT